MSNQLERVKRAMLKQFMSEGQIRIAEFVARHPENRDELLDYAFWVESTVDEVPNRTDAVWEDHGDAVRTALKTIHKQVQRDALAQEEKELAASLSKGRKAVNQRRGRGSASPEFRRAAIYAWTFDLIRGEEAAISRFRTVKTTYLLERGLELRLFTSHKKMAAGPYDPDLRYRDAEPIGEDQNWIEVHEATITAGPNIDKAHKYAPRYVGDPRIARRFLSFLAKLTDRELETWTTVDAAVCDLSEQDREVSTGSVKEFIASEPRWRGKLDRPHFDDEKIHTALRHLFRLGILR